jgi:uncharacterized protein (DUF362 family)
MHSQISRRQLLSGLGAAAAGVALSRPALASEAPASTVAVAKCKTYGSELTPALEQMFDQLGGLGRIVKGKTVAVKINMTGSGGDRVGHHPAALTHWTHPRVIGATAHLLGKAGARRIRILESPWQTAAPIEEVMLAVNWDPQLILGAAPNVEFENTNWLGNAKKYSRFYPPDGGYMFKSYDLNHSYEDCDVFVSLTKMKEHATCGVTLSMKNCFGATPCTIYGEGAGKDEPSEFPHGGRTPIHYGNRNPSGYQENDPKSPRKGGYRVPRVVADLVAARPVHLAIVEGITTMNRGEGPWIRGSQLIRPGVIVAGTNCVSTDAVSMAVMGFDPAADRGTAPFETSDSHLRLAAKYGVGTYDLRRIEVTGTPIREARFPFRTQPPA